MKFDVSRFSLTMCGLGLAGLTLAIVAATPAQTAPTKPAAKPAAQDAGAMGDMSAMMPNEHHKKLARRVGTWHADVSFSMSEGAPPMKNTGTVEIKSIMDGRYMLETVKGDPSPMGNYEGMGISGFNNRTGKYENTWLDNMGTAQAVSTGEDDPATGDIMWHSEAPNMMTGKLEANRSTMTKGSEDLYTWDTYTTTDGKEWKSMEITYTRVK